MAVGIAGSDAGMSRGISIVVCSSQCNQCRLPYSPAGIDADRAADLDAGAGAFDRNKAGAVFGAGRCLAAGDGFRGPVGGWVLRCRFAARLGGERVSVRQHGRERDHGNDKTNGRHGESHRHDPGWVVALYHPRKRSNHGAPQPRAVLSIQSLYNVSGVTPVRPPHPALMFGPVDQLTTPTTTLRPS